MLGTLLLAGCGNVTSPGSPDASPPGTPDASPPGTPDATPVPDAIPGPDAGPQPLAITAVDPPFLARGSRVTIRGTGFTGITSINLGGQALVPASQSDTELVIDPLPDAVPPGQVTLRIQREAETVMRDLAAGDLLLNEVDPVPDTREFVEIAVPAAPGGATSGLAVSGYVLVAFDHATNRSVGAVAISATTSAGSLILLRTPQTAPTGPLGAESIIDYPAAFLPNSQAAVAIYQGSLADFPLGTAVTSQRLIDAMVYEADDDTTFATPCTLLGALYRAQDTCVIDEDFGDDGNTQDTGRCFSSTRRASSPWRVLGVETPGAANDCASALGFRCTQPVCGG